MRIVFRYIISTIAIHAGEGSRYVSRDGATPGAVFDLFSSNHVPVPVRDNDNDNTGDNNGDGDGRKYCNNDDPCQEDSQHFTNDSGSNSNHRTTSWLATRCHEQIGWVSIYDTSIHSTIDTTTTTTDTTDTTTTDTHLSQVKLVNKFRAHSDGVARLIFFCGIGNHRRSSNGNNSTSNGNGNNGSMLATVGDKVSCFFQKRTNQCSFLIKLKKMTVCLSLVFLCVVIVYIISRVVFHFERLKQMI